MSTEAGGGAASTSILWGELDSLSVGWGQLEEGGEGRIRKYEVLSNTRHTGNAPLVHLFPGEEEEREYRRFYLEFYQLISPGNEAARRGILSLYFNCHRSDPNQQDIESTKGLCEEMLLTSSGSPNSRWDVYKELGIT